MKHDLKEKLTLLNLLLIVTALGLAGLSVHVLELNDTNTTLDNDTNDSDVNVSVSNTTCVDHDNQSICYNSENRSEANLSQLENPEQK